MEVMRVSPRTGLTNIRVIDVTPEQYIQWTIGGMLIHDAMPNISADDREFILSGYTPEDWDEITGGLDEDDYYDDYFDDGTGYDDDIYEYKKEF